MENKSAEKNICNKIPEPLRLMCKAEILSGNRYCAEPILRFLLDQFRKPDTLSSPLDNLRCMVFACDTAFTPLEVTAGNWERFYREIHEILNISGNLVDKLFSSDCEDTTVLQEVQVIADKVNTYIAMLHMVTEDYESLSHDLERCRMATERNTTQMLYDGEKSEEMLMFFPLNMLLEDYLPNLKSEIMLARCYEDYVIFLSERRMKMPVTEMYPVAEYRLREFAVRIIDHIENELEDLDDDGFFTKISMEEKLKEMISRSYKREATSPETDIPVYMGISEVVESIFWDRAKVFTDRLRKTLNQYPELDVILLSPLLSCLEEKDCSVVMVKDLQTAEFTKKAIAIHSSQMQLEDNHLDIPFFEDGRRKQLKSERSHR